MEISKVESINQAKSVLKRSRRIFVLTGAGISAESGVPTFRGGGGAGVWRGMPFEQLSSAEMVEKDLPLVWEWFDYRRGKVSACEPNAAHKTLAKAQGSDQFEEFSVVTQNIDGLHQTAGTENVIELHGSVWQARCLSCKTKQSLREISDEERPPVCPECFDSMRPDVILFGEAMPMQSVYEAQEKAQNCDVCFVIGTSALVYPAAELPLIAKQSGAKIIEINPEETALSSQADISLRGKAAEILPLIFAEEDSPNLPLPDDEFVKSAANQNRSEKRIEDRGNFPTSENPLQNDQQLKNNFMTSETHPLRVCFLKSEEFPVLNELGLTFAPGKKQLGALSGNWNRDLVSDLTRLRDEFRTDTLVSLVEENELAELSIQNLEHECCNHDIELVRFPLRDVSVPPSLKSFAHLIREITKRLRQKKSVVVHCKGGLGRAGLTAACSIVAASDNKISSAEAIKMVRWTRTGAIETKEQEDFVSLFSEYWQLYNEKIEDVLRQQKTAVKEKVLEIGCEGGGLDLFRFKTSDGKWYFCAEGSSISLDENDDEEWIHWETEAVETITEAIDDFKLGSQIFMFHSIFFHPQHRVDIEEYLKTVYAALSSEEKMRLRRFDNAPITIEKWLAEADVRTLRKVEQKEFWQQSSDDQKSEQNHQSDEIATDSQQPDKHFLIYWQERNVLAHGVTGNPLDVVSSQQLKRVKAGDTLWLVTINQSGELILAGRLKIGEIVDYKTAVERLNDSGLWDGGFYALSQEDKAEYLRPTNMGEAAFDLRFANTASDRLVLKNGKINPQQLQTMRELTEDSAEMLARIWEIEEKEENNDDFEDDLSNVKYFRQCVRKQPLNPLFHYKLGFYCDINGLTEEANAAYRKAIELVPNARVAYEKLGHNYLRAGELDKAREVLEDAVRLAPEYAPSLFLLGEVYSRMGDFEKAIAVTNKGLEYDQDNPIAYFNVGDFYFHLQNYEKAVHWLKKSAEIDPADPKTFYRLGECCRHLGEKQKEFDAYLQAVELVPDFADALFALGTVYAHLTETEEGERVPYFETGGELDLQDGRVSFYLGLGNLALGNIDIAQDSLNDLGKTDEGLADKLQFFIDRFVPNNEEAANPAAKTKTAKTAGQKRKPIEFYINDQSFEAKNIPEMYQKALEYLVDARMLDDLSLPVATGEKRYILAKEPIHPTGKPFLTPVEYKGFLMEAHNNRAAAIAQLRKLIESVSYTFSEIFNFDPGMDDEPEELNLDAEKLKKYQGCLLGGAVGDALGAAIEFDSIRTIRQKFGEQGLTDYAPAYGRIGSITDDTQMTLFTAEGLLRANTRYNHRGICSPPSVIYHAYLRWLETQGIKLSDETIKSSVYDTQSWLRDLPELNSRRAPGNSCLSALQSGKMGTIEAPINNSKGCGGVMRVAPVGLIALDAFGLACEAAAITHGHPTGYLSAGVLSLIIQQIIEGKTLNEAIQYAAYTILPQHPKHEETFAACDKAIKLARDKTILPSPEVVESLGDGWVAEEALAIAIYCSLVHETDFKKAVLLAVNHSGDSDSTGAITGNILGALSGIEAIPDYWLDRIELKNAIAEVAEDLLIGFRTGDKWWSKYPGT